ncbi:hypothetical protein SAMN06295970_11639 [Noviherbaspirillum suwonense]|uniref:Uncharacterized protein n=1 Tax=Noviherbaspirillum suwonense TaxID=1224511 RepID=A0ABY1QH73_9BURK|nr:hypothetical protein SAMN06295970_11639 [Noviherbaspirillum suwonense]
MCLQLPLPQPHLQRLSLKRLPPLLLLLLQPLPTQPPLRQHPLHPTQPAPPLPLHPQLLTQPALLQLPSNSQAVFAMTGPWAGFFFAQRKAEGDTNPDPDSQGAMKLHRV